MTCNRLRIYPGDRFSKLSQSDTQMKDNPFTTLSRRIRAPFNRRWALRRLQEYHAAPRSLEQTVDWAMNFGGKGHFRISTLQVRKEILGLAEKVAALQPKRILEIGTARGGTLLIWSAMAAERVVSCDLRDMSLQQGLLEALPPSGSKCRVTLLSGDSHTKAFRQRVGETLNGELVDFLFIDGDHTAQGVTQDYQDYKDLVRPGGLIAFHDIVEKQSLTTNQVYSLWKTVRNLPGAEEIVADPNQSGCGIGVLRVAG
jgi:predicted O-methyltransferase YrrM